MAGVRAADSHSGQRDKPGNGSPSHPASTTPVSDTAIVHDLRGAWPKLARREGGGFLPGPSFGSTAASISG